MIYYYYYLYRGGKGWNYLQLVILFHVYNLISKDGTKIYVKFVSYPTGSIVILVLKMDSLENKKINENNIEQSLKESNAYSFLYM